MAIILEPSELWVAAYEQVLYRFAPSGTTPYPAVSIKASIVWAWGNNAPTSPYKNVPKKVVGGYAEFDFQQIIQDLLSSPIPTQLPSGNLFNPLSANNFTSHTYGYISYAIVFQEQWVDVNTGYLQTASTFTSSAIKLAVRGGFQYNEDKSYIPYYNGNVNPLFKIKFLTHYPQGTTLEYAKKFPKCIGRYQYEWLYAIVGTQTNSIQIIGYDETGINQVASQFISNTVINQLVSFGVSGGSVSSSILTNTAIKYYSVLLWQNGFSYSSIIWYKIVECPPAIRVHWLNPLGGVDSYSFFDSYIDSEISVTGKNFQQSSQYYGQIGTQYNYASPGNIPIKKDGVNTFTVFAFGLAPEVRKWLIELSTSPEVYIEQSVWDSGALSANETATPTIQYIRVDVKTDEFPVNTTREVKPDIKFTFIVSNNVNTQRN